MTRTFKPEAVYLTANNIAKATADVAGYTAGTIELADTADGSIWVQNEAGVAVVTEAQVQAAKTLQIMQYVDGKIVSTPPFAVADVKAIKTYLPEVYKGKRTLIGAMSPEFVNNATIVPGGAYSATFTVTSRKNPRFEGSVFQAAAKAAATGTDITGKLYIDLVKSLYSNYPNNTFSKYFRAAAHSDAAQVATVTIGAKTDSKDITYTGTLVVGTYLAYQGTNGDGRVQPRAIYKVEYVDAVAKTAVLSQPWIAQTIAATAVDTVVLDDTDEWGFFVESKATEYRDVQTTKVLDTTYEYTQGEYILFEAGDIHSGEGTLAGCPTQGHHSMVKYNQMVNWNHLEEGDYAENAVPGCMYSTVMIQISKLATAELSVTPVSQVFNIFLQKGTIAEVIAGTASAFSTNIISGTGIGDSPNNSFINVINHIGLAAKVFTAGVNTVKGAGGQLAELIDV